MKTMRLILADRLSGGIIAASTALMLLLQAVVGSLACGMTIGAGLDPASVICSPSGTASAGHTRSDGPSGPDRQHDCPCILFCQFGGSVAALLPVDGLTGSAFMRAAAAVPPFEHHRLADSRNSGLISEARAPPALSV
ncbi:DUF2946 family protein [Rhodospirillaceae bacterium SYSU D60014]|uniref:DUF2946 family protein n=1 Tax=Virgifigura deserti TaxID=2268457 RepID=UPI000E65ECD3